MKKLIFLYLLAAVILSPHISFTNNIAVGAIDLIGQNQQEHYVYVQFDLSWDNSFRDDVNWDAAWVFVKYKVTGGEWAHATLNTSGHTAPGGSTIDTPSDGKGVFIYRDVNGSGTFSLSGVQLRWNYGTDGVWDGAMVTVKVIAIEMVYVTEGPFYIGDGTSTGRFREYGSDTPVQITTTPVVIKCEYTTHDDDQLQGNGILVDGDDGIDMDGTVAVDNPDYPTGYNAFYCMKYEITQEQYVDFLNMLTRTQQNTRTYTSIPPGITEVSEPFVMCASTTRQYRNIIRCNYTIPENDPIIFYCDYDLDDIGNESNDGQNIACNFLSWADGAAYADWVGLRPMTELEFEKACRGYYQTAIAGEYAWGTTEIAAIAYYPLSNSGSADEGIAYNYSTEEEVGNCSYVTTDGSINGPLRVGIFAAHGSNSGRVTAGASYYAIMEMSGNLWERCVNIGNGTGRAFTGTNGDGALDASGNADASTWPGTDATGAGLRGCSWNTVAAEARVSDRSLSALVDIGRIDSFGFRCVRSAPSIP